MRKCQLRSLAFGVIQELLQTNPQLRHFSTWFVKKKNHQNINITVIHFNFVNKIHHKVWARFLISATNLNRPLLQVRHY